jgi:hypothetical protein
MNNVHDDEPVVFQTRWAMSYLRGPMTGQQIKTLMDPLRKGAERRAPGKAAGEPAAAREGAASEAPAVAPEIAQYFAPAIAAASGGGALVYRPHLVGVARVNYTDVKSKVDTTQEVCFLTPISDEAIPVRWEDASDAGFAASALEKRPSPGAKFAALPPAAAKMKSYTTWEKDFVQWVYGNQRLKIWRSPTLKELSRPGEGERDFRVRLQQTAREQRDGAVEKLREKYTEKTAALRERLRRAQQAVERESDQAKQQKTQTAISFGATLLGAFVGRRGLSTTIGRATTAARGVSRSMKEQEDIGRAQDTVESLGQRLAAIEEEFRAETAALEAKFDPETEELESLTLQPKKTGISVQLVALTWAPFRQGAGGEIPAFR